MNAALLFQTELYSIKIPRFVCASVYRVSSLWKNHGNLENEKNFFQTWKNHGIWKEDQKPGKIMEFEKIHLEKSWNFFSDLKHCQWNQFFARFAHISSIMYIFGCVHFIDVHWFFPNLFLSYILWLISTWINVMLYKSFLIHIYSVLVSWKNGNISGKIMEKSWNLIPEFGWKPCV